jgi:hypothetical protein
MFNDINDDPLLPYLAEIVACPEAQGIILSGGFGMRLKQYHLIQQREAAGGQQITLVVVFPEARATQDLDLFLNVNIWVEIDKAKVLSAAIHEPLGYETATYSWQYRKPLAGVENRFVKLDMMARHPRLDEIVKVKGNPKQVGREMGTGISGRETREAFAIDDSPILLTFPFGEKEHSVLVPHPYAWLNMKVRAAYDWLLERRGLVDAKLTKEGDRVRLKHVYDVYVLIAMLTPEELAQSAALAAKYFDHEEARKTLKQAIELYGSADAVGIQTVEAYARLYMGDDLAIDHDLFWRDGLKVALGIEESGNFALESS